MAELAGSIVAIVTPFSEDRLDLAAFSDLLEWHLASGTSAVCVAGTTGEGATLRPGERDALCRRAREVLKGRCPLVAGAGTNATWSSVEAAREAAAAGADALLVVVPYYSKPPQEGIVRHFEAVARAAAGVPLIAYDVPGRTAVRLEEETVRRLARVPGVVALKDATGDLERAGRIARGTPLTVLSGDDAHTLAMMERGARGVVSVAANVVPAAVAALVRDRSREAQERLQPLCKALFVESNPVPVKFALAAMGRIRNELRLPLTPLAEAHHASVRAALQAAGAL